jgi:hypothetical protein
VPPPETLRRLARIGLSSPSVCRAARLAGLGTRKGEPAALFLGNCPLRAIAHCGIRKPDTNVCPCSSLNKKHESTHQFRGDLRVQILIEGFVHAKDRVAGLGVSVSKHGLAGRPALALEGA